MIAAMAIPKLAAGVRLKRDAVRGGFNLLAPERVLRANATSAEILELCDGKRPFAEIVDQLAKRYVAERVRIEEEAAHLLEGLAAKGMITL